MQANEISETMDSVATMAEHGYDDAFIEAWLQKKNVSDDEIRNLLEFARTTRVKKSDRIARQLLLGGIVILGLGFILSVTFAHSGNSVTVPLYGLTATGTVLLLLGIGKLMH